MNPRESVGPKARPNPTTHQAIAPVTASKMFFTTIPLQCVLLAPEASTIIKPSCIKKIRAVEAIIQLELDPVLIVSRTTYWAVVKGSALAKFLDGSANIPVVDDIELCVYSTDSKLLLFKFKVIRTGVFLETAY